MYYSLERFEGKIAVLVSDDKSIVNIKRDDLPFGIHLGDILIKTANEQYIIDKEETKKRKERIQMLQTKLFKSRNN